MLKSSVARIGKDKISHNRHLNILIIVHRALKESGRDWFLIGCWLHESQPIAPSKHCTATSPQHQNQMWSDQLTFSLGKFITPASHNIYHTTLNCSGVHCAMNFKPDYNALYIIIHHFIALHCNELKSTEYSPRQHWMQCIAVENGAKIVDVGHEQHKVMADVGGQPSPDEHFLTITDPESGCFGNWTSSTTERAIRIRLAPEFVKSLKDVDSPGQPKPSAGTRGENVKMIIRTRPDQCDDEDDANVKPCSSSVIRVWQRDETSLLRVQPAPLGWEGEDFDHHDQLDHHDHDQHVDHHEQNEDADEHIRWISWMAFLQSADAAGIILFSSAGQCT